jgi:chromosome segregation ATPase
MDPARARAAKLRAWQRFGDRVASNPDWPRSLWLAAVEDALAAALGPDSRMFAEFRAQVGELLTLERATPRGYQDELRIAELEARIERLIELADDMVKAGAEASAQAAARHRWLRPLLSSALGALLLLAGIAGATALHEARLDAEVNRQMQRIGSLIDGRVADLRADLDQRLSLAQRLSQETKQLHDRFGAEVDQLSATMAGSMRSMVALSDQTVSEIQRRLDARGGDASGAQAGLQARADALGRGLDGVGQGLSRLQERLPKLVDQVEGVAASVQRLRAETDRSAAAISAVSAGTPELVASLEQQKSRLGHDLDQHKTELDALTSKIKDVESLVDRSRARLDGFNRSLDQGLTQAKRDGAALQSTVQDLHATGLQAAQLVADAEAKAEARQQELQKKIDQILSQAAEKADLAAARSQDAARRAEGDVTRKLQGESQQAVDDLSKAREAQLAELSKRVGAIQAELDQSRTGLLASWQTMDQAVANRQRQVLTDLDGYAQIIQGRIQDLIKALDVKVAGGNG